jgi:hypothetical protein
METEIKQKEKNEMLQKNKNLALTTLSEKKLPTDIMDFLVTDEQEKTKENIDLFSQMMESYTTSIKNNKMASNNTVLPGKDEVLTGGKIPEPAEGASKAEWKEYWNKMGVTMEK